VISLITLSYMVFTLVNGNSPMSYQKDVKPIQRIIDLFHYSVVFQKFLNDL
jgi:hypothetical protein